MTKQVPDRVPDRVLHARMEAERRLKARTSLVEYARYIEIPGAPTTAETDDDGDDATTYRPVETPLAEHHILMLELIQRTLEKPRGRAMLFLPPGSAKSSYTSVVAPTWAMGLTPGYKAIGVSYGSDLAKKFGRRMRSIVRQDAYRRLFGSELGKESRAADEWSLTNGSDYMGAGIISGITGNRADAIFIDDPLRGRQDADSALIRERIREAYQDDVLTRLKPEGSLFIVMTRWHMDDLAGSILPEDYNGESGMIECRDGEVWEVLNIPAECERADDPLHRKIGEMIWPEWFSEAHWRPFRRVPRTWNALYQQRPAAESGDYFKREWIIEEDRLPERATMHVYGGSDYAVTSAGGDYTVHAVLGIDNLNQLWLLDLWRKQADSAEWVESMLDLVRKWKPIGWAEETGQIKAGVGPFLQRRMMERSTYVAREVFPTRGDKAIRAQSIRGRMANIGLRVPRGAHFLPDLMAELMSFPVGVNDDQVDALGLVGQLLDKMKIGDEPLPVEPEQAEPGFIPPPLYVVGKRRTTQQVHSVLPSHMIH